MRLVASFGTLTKLLVVLLTIGALALYSHSGLWETMTFKSHEWILKSKGNKSAVDHLDGTVGNKVKNTVSTRARRFPQCIIIGVKKCGTRALLTFLDLHSDIVIAKSEMHFFDREENYKKGMKWYRKYMPFSDANQYTIEKTPSYFVEDKVPERIKMMNSSIKLLVILCNPTTRAISECTQYSYKQRLLNKTVKSFKEMIADGDVIRKGHYHVYLSRWFAAFPRDQIHVVDGDNFRFDPVSEMERVEDFLGLENQIVNDKLYFNETKGFYCKRINNTKEKCLGESKGRQPMYVETTWREKIKNYYKPYNNKLFKMLNRTFDW